MLQLGIVGLPNVGKSTLFNALTNAGAEASNYPFCTVEPNVGVVVVPDQRLEILSEIVRPEKVIPARVEFVDIAGLVRGASRGEGLGNQFLARIREVDALVHVVRCFDDDTVSHPEATVDPPRDIEIVNTELALADLATVDRRREKLTAQVKRGIKDSQGELETLDRLSEHLDSGLPVSTLELPGNNRSLLKELNLLTLKPVIYVANLSEDLAGHYEDSSRFRDMQSYAEQQGAEAVPICSQIEAEVAELPAEDAAELIEGLGLGESSLNRFIQKGYKLLNLITFFTIKPPEVSAWPILAGTRAPEAAGKIHTDMQHGFIKAEVVSYEDLHRLMSLHSVREEGLMRLEGKDYEVKDGDVVLFKFSPPK